jgi:hypothetical protein
MTAAFFDRSSSQSGARLAMLIGALLLGAACLVATVLPAPAEADSCPNAAFRAGAAAHLPDCRAYEMVSPPHKLANSSFGGGGMYAWPSPDGNRIRYWGRVDGLPNGDFANLLAARGSNGWATLPVAPMEDRGDYGYVNGAEGPTTADLSAFTLVGRPGGSLNFRNLPYKVQIVRPGESVQTIATIPGDLFGRNAPSVSGASDDLSHVLWVQPFNGLDPLAVDPPAPEIEDGVKLLYEWVNGVRTIVSTNPDGSLISKCGSVAGNGDRRSTYSAISADGFRVFFQAPDPAPFSNPACAAEPSRLYIREGTAAPRLISAPEPGVSDPNGHQPAYFLGASQDGDKAFFSTTEQLTSQDAPGDSDIYLYGASSQELKLVTVAPDGTANAHIFFALVSNDGSTVYVALRRPMVAGTGDPNVPNLYKYDTGTGQWTFVATLPGNDPSISSADWTWYTTNSGRFLLFRSRTDLSTGDPDGLPRIYRYDSLNEELSCVSCVPGGQPAVFAEPDWGAGHTFEGSSRPQRGITEDGQTVAFDTTDALVPADANQARDLYEWHNGTISLISTGSGDANSTAEGMSADGRDIFFSTEEQLLPQDQDSYVDLYDARVGGGFSPGTEGRSCSEVTCSLPAAPPLQVSRPASAEVRGPGNLRRRKHVMRSLEILAPGPTALSQAARTGILRLKVHSSSAGRLRALARASIGGKKRIVARAATGVRRVGNVTLPLHLSPGARQKLAEEGVLKLTISVSLSGAQEKTTTVSIRRPR